MNRLTLAALFATAAVAALSAAPASAQTKTLHDAAHDVLSQPADSSGVPRDPAPRRREGDALSLRVTHGPHRLRLVLHFARLTKTEGPAAQVLAVRTNTGKRAELVLFTTKASGSVQRSWQVNGHERSCPGLRSRVEYRKAIVRAAIPRRCLGNPSWVRAGGGNGTLARGRLFADDVTLDSKVRHEVALGPRVRRG